MGNAIIKLPSSGGGMNTSDADALPSDVTSGKIFYGSDGREVGTHVFTDDLQDGDAVPSNVTSGKIFYNKNGRQVGTRDSSMLSWSGRESRGTVLVKNSWGSYTNALIITEASSDVYSISTKENLTFATLKVDGDKNNPFSDFGGSSYKAAAIKVNGKMYTLPYPFSGNTITMESILSFAYNAYVLLPYNSELGWIIHRNSNYLNTIKKSDYSTSGTGLTLSKDYDVTLYYYMA